MNLFNFDLSDWHRVDFLSEALKTDSFFKEHKLVFCDHVFENETVAEIVGGLIENLKISSSHDVTLVVVENASLKNLMNRKKLLKIVSSGAQVSEEINFLEGQALSGWLKKEFEIRKCQISNGVIQK